MSIDPAQTNAFRTEGDARSNAVINLYIRARNVQDNFESSSDMPSPMLERLDCRKTSLAMY